MQVSTLFSGQRARLSGPDRQPHHDFRDTKSPALAYDYG